MNLAGYDVIGSTLDKKLHNSGRVLEIGCGHGMFVEVLHQQGYDACGLDKATTGFIKQLKCYNRLMQADAQHIPFKNQFDAVVSNSVLSSRGLETIAGFDGAGWIVLGSDGELQKQSKQEPEVVAKNIHKSVYQALKPNGFAVHIVPECETVLAPPPKLYESNEILVEIDGAKYGAGLFLRKI
jgi:SAM-dependent methyltransferase